MKKFCTRSMLRSIAGARAVAVKWNLPEGKKRQKLKLKNTRHATSLCKNFMSHGEE